jgi:hypothetical protein
MTFAAPLGLLALLAVPAIVVLHLFRNRLPERTVAGLFLFPATPVVTDGGRTRTRLWRSPSLWLECLAATLAALWLAGMTFGGLLPRHLIVVLDDSASMAARQAHQRAEAALLALGDDLGADDRVTVVRTGRPAAIVVGPRAARAQLETFVPTWAPARPGHSLQPALDLARQFAGTVDEIVCVTDREPQLPIDDVRLIACGVATGNAAITSVQRLPGDGGDRLRVTVVGYGAVGGDELVVTAGGRELGRPQLELAADGRPRRIELALPPDVGEVQVALPDDELLLDNVAWSLPPRPRTVAVCDQLPTASRAALELDRVFDAMAGWRDEPRPEAAQVVLRAEPGPTRAGQLQLVLRQTPGPPRGHRGPFVIDRSRALCVGLTLDGVGWQAGGGDLPGQVLIASGSKVLLSEELTDDARRLHVDVDGRAGNLVRAPDWPILFANVLELGRREVPGCERRELRVGEELRYRVGLGDTGAVLRSPAGEWLGKVEDGAITYDTEAPGVHRVTAASGAPLDEVAVQFVDAGESDLRRASSADRLAEAAVREAAAARVDPSSMRRLLAVLLLAVLLLDWWWLQRRGG